MDRNWGANKKRQKYTIWPNPVADYPKTHLYADTFEEALEKAKELGKSWTGRGIGILWYDEDGLFHSYEYTDHLK